MTLEEYEQLEQDFLSSSTDIRSFLQRRGVSPHKYYYWKRRSRELKESAVVSEGQFLPIDLHSGSLIVIRNQKCSIFGNLACSNFGNSPYTIFGNKSAATVRQI